MKSSRNVRSYFRTAAKLRKILSLFSVGIIAVVISGVATAQIPNAGSPIPANASATAEDKAIRPFKFNASKDALADMRKRIAATRWPDKETVTDQSQGVQLATIQKLARYWATDYDWRKCEAKLNALPQFITEIDGVDIHFIHVRSKNPNALPLIVTHALARLDHRAVEDHRSAGESNGTWRERIGRFRRRDSVAAGRAWIVLMKRLGYTRFVAQGGDWEKRRILVAWSMASQVFRSEPQLSWKLFSK
jgi:hypothetical protein